jgi:hypothetical protein
MQLRPVSAIASHYDLTASTLIAGIQRGMLQGIQINGEWFTSIPLVEAAISAHAARFGGR